MASVQNSQHFKKTGRLENLNILQLQDARKTHFPTFSSDLGYILHHLNHCYLVLFISKPQSTNFEQNLTRSLHFIGLTSEVGGASFDLSVSNCSYSLAKKDANLRPVAQRTLELHARELVSIYEVKISAR